MFKKRKERDKPDKLALKALIISSQEITEGIRKFTMILLILFIIITQNK